MNRHASIRCNGVHVGDLAEEGDGYSFQYHADYVARDDAQSVSLTLPLTDQPYRSVHLFPFFEGLLAEGALAAIQCRTLRIDERDLFGRLLATCQDTIGAITVEAQNS